MKISDIDEESSGDDLSQYAKTNWNAKLSQKEKKNTYSTSPSRFFFLRYHGLLFPCYIIMEIVLPMR